MELFLYQSFFDNLSSEFIPPLLENLPYFQPNITDKNITLFDDDFVISYDLTEIGLEKASIDKTPPIVQINNGDITFGLYNLFLNLTAGYNYISEPPIFADIGEMSFQIANFTLSTIIDSHLSEGSNAFSLQFSNTTIESTPEQFCYFDGISDFSEVVTNLANTLAAVVRNRLESLINGGELYPVDAKI